MNVLTNFAGYIFERITQTANEITPEIMDWKPVRARSQQHILDTCTYDQNRLLAHTTVIDGYL